MKDAGVTIVESLPRRAAIQLVVVLVALAFALISASTTPAATSGLVAAYAFDEGSGTTVADASGNGNNGTVANATWAAAGKNGKALSFNGSSSRVTIPDAASLHLTSAMTLEAWVNPATVNANWRDVVYKGDDNYYLMATSSNSGRPAAGAIIGGSYGEAYGTANLATGTWTHLAFTYDGSAERLYVNGTQVASTAKTGSIKTSTNPLTIGSDAIYGQYFSGLIDDVRVYSTALTQAQIQSDMTTPVGPAAPDGQPPSAPTYVERVGVQRHPRRPELGRGRRQRRGHRLPHRALPGRRLHHLYRDRRPGRHRHQLQRHHRRRRHQLQLPRPRQRRRRQPRPLLQQRERDNAQPRTASRRRRPAR